MAAGAVEPEARRAGKGVAAIRAGQVSWCGESRGYPGDLWLGKNAYRFWMPVRTLGPLARVVEAGLEARLETPVSLDMTGLYAHNLVGRASAFQRSRGGVGVSVAEALTTSGLLGADAEAAA